jgi:hypothetical protein
MLVYSDSIRVLNQRPLIHRAMNGTSSNQIYNTQRKNTKLLIKEIVESLLSFLYLFSFSFFKLKIL